MIKCYSELSTLTTFNDRFEYLKLDGSVGVDTFGFDRYLNQVFYKSPEWRRIRDLVIIRDHGCDLGIEGYEIHGKILIHHMNPITVGDIVSRSEWIMNPEFLISTTHKTHNAIHYSTEVPYMELVDRRPGDTCPWK